MTARSPAVKLISGRIPLSLRRCRMLTAQTRLPSREGCLSRASTQSDGEAVLVDVEVVEHRGQAMALDHAFHRAQRPVPAFAHRRHDDVGDRPAEVPAHYGAAALARVIGREDVVGAQARGEVHVVVHHAPDHDVRVEDAEVGLEHLGLGLQVPAGQRSRDDLVGMRAQLLVEQLAEHRLEPVAVLDLPAEEHGIAKQQDAFYTRRLQLDLLAAQTEAVDRVGLARGQEARPLAIHEGVEQVAELAMGRRKERPVAVALGERLLLQLGPGQVLGLDLLQAPQLGEEIAAQQHRRGEEDRGQHQQQVGDSAARAGALGLPRVVHGVTAGMCKRSRGLDSVERGCPAAPSLRAGPRRSRANIGGRRAGRARRLKSHLSLRASGWPGRDVAIGRDRGRASAVERSPRASRGASGGADAPARRLRAQ
jgi:hypothetical protein